MTWHLKRIKARTTVTPFITALFVPKFHPSLPPPPPPLYIIPNVFPSSSSPTSSFSSSVHLRSATMKNFRPPQFPTISTTVLKQSSDFKLPPNHVQDPLGKRCSSPEEWTDEKHSMYLKSMEASFVNQLYNSEQVPDWRSPKATLSRLTHTTSTQWKDLGDGYWRRMEHKREKKGQKSRRHIEGSDDLKGEPWIQQLGCSSCSVADKASVTDRATRNQIPSASPHHPGSLFSDIEMTDQNFVDDEEVVECEKKNVKRLKHLISHTSMHQC